MFHKIEDNLISQLIGFVVVLSAILNFTNLKIEKKLLLNKYFSTLYGLFCGVIGGATTLVGPLIAVLLVSLKLEKEEFSELSSRYF